MHIVTNGKRYRILRTEPLYGQEFWKEYSCGGPDGELGYEYIWETRFFWRAKRKLLRIRKAQLQRAAIPYERWEPVSELY